MSYTRGAVWFAAIPDLGDKPVLIVSWDVVNHALRSVVVARVSSVERERTIPTVVSVPAGEIDALEERSFVICHDLFTLPKPFRRFAGFLSARRMLEVDDALRQALDLG